jgi:hypothetical protein
MPSKVYERNQGIKFDWVVRSRPDLACAQPLPNLARLPAHTVYSTMKERGEMWDTLFLVPRHLLTSFRNASMFVAERSPPDPKECLDPARNKMPEVALFQGKLVIRRCWQR